METKIPDAPPTDAPPKKEKKKKLTRAERKHLKIQARLDFKCKLLREQLLREIELTKKSLKRGKIIWEDMCKDVKLKELRLEIRDWTVKANEAIERKDEKINLLLKNADETQELHERSFSQHLENLDYLTKCHEALRGTATEVYEMQASQMIEDFLFEALSINDKQERINLNTENVIHSSNVVAKDTLRKNYELYMVRKFDEVTTEIEKRYIYRDETALKMRNLQDKLLLFMKILQGDMVDVHKTEKFLYFMDRQRNYVKEANRLCDIERMSRKILSDLHSELLFIESDSNRKIYGLKLEQAYFLEVRLIIKNSIDRNKQLTQEKLLAVASESYHVINKLKEFMKNGELLLSLGACCRKYKTEKEKVLIGEHESASIEPDFILKMKFDLVKYLDISEEELVDQMAILKNFWRRCSNVRLHNLLLMEEKRRLTEENEKYRNIIRSMKKSDDVKYILESLNVKQLLE